MSTTESQVIVDLPNYGKLRGATRSSFWKNEKIYQFLGVKYGESPSGPRRFKKSELAKAWKEVRDATKPGRKCPSDKNIHELIEEKEINPNIDFEDCLNLSVYSKNLNGLAPVMFFIESSGYFHDGREKLPDFLLDEDVVLVVPNYRTGVLGFTSTRTTEVPGNAGLSDIVLALEWVQLNIKHFGGNANNVTVMGQSFGSALAHALLLASTHAVPQNYFHRVIMQSGSAYSPAYVDNDPIKQAQRVGYVAGCKDPSASIEAVNDALMSISVEDLFSDLWDYKYQGQDYEPHELGLSKLIFDDSMFMLQTNLFCSKRECVPVMAGVTKNDGVFSFTKLLNILENRIEIRDPVTTSYLMLNCIRDFLGVEDQSGALTCFAQKELFTQEEIVKGDFDDMIHGFIDFCGAVMIKCPLLKTVQDLQRLDPKNLYLYSFDYCGQIKECFARLGIPEFNYDCGVYHSYDTLFLFPWNDSRSEMLKNMSDQDLNVAKLMVQLWTSFAKNGVPSAENTTAWPKATEISGPVMHIDTSLHLTNDFLDELSITVRDARAGKKLVKSKYFCT